MITFWEESLFLANRLYGKILNAGAGDGDYTLELRKISGVHEVVSLDFLPIWTLHHNKRFCLNVPDGKWFQGDVRAMPFPDNHFDGVACVDVLQNVRNAERALIEFRRVTRHNGFIFIRLHFRGKELGGSFAEGDIEWGSSDLPFTIHTLWEPAELVAHAEGTGLKLAEPVFINSEQGICALFSVQKSPEEAARMGRKRGLEIAPCGRNQERHTQMLESIQWPSCSEIACCAACANLYTQLVAKVGN